MDSDEGRQPGVTSGSGPRGNGAVVALGNGNGSGGGNGHGPNGSLALLVESLLFVADKPVAVTDLARALEVERKTVDRALDDLAAGCQARGVRLQRTNGRVQMVTAPEAAAAIQRFLGLDVSGKLSRPALDVLAMVAYRQPVTRPEVDAVRGVDSEAVFHTLTARGLVEPVGRRHTVGHPIEYGTTFLFLEYFGLTGLDDLPHVDALAELAAEGAPTGDLGTSVSLADEDALDA
jgi:segregation and condensation protein B